MKPQINKIKFGSITIGEEKYKHDVLIRLDGAIKKRKKKLSKEKYGTSHIISLEEARFIYQEGAEGLIIGAGMFGRVELSSEAAEFFNQKRVQVWLFPNQEALEHWNTIEGENIGLFHTTC